MNTFRDKKVIAALLKEIKAKALTLPLPIRLMEVCGTHTMTIHKYGLKTMLEDAGVEMTSGPGCPVCITPNEIHEAALDLLTGQENLVLATFGDMTRVPTRRGSLQTAVPAPNSRMKIVYSPEESIEVATQTPEKEVVFFGVGFETTIPAVALTAQKASTLALRNYSILSALWVIPPPLRAIVESGTLKINGFLYPGHVSVIIGQKPYQFLADDYNIPGAIAGFEPADICLAISSVLDQMIEKKPGVFIEYSRAVQPGGNLHALSLMEEVLEPKDAFWRGLGLIPRSGLKLKNQYSAFDAELKYGLKIKGGSGDLPGCRCGEVLRGIISPQDCPLFGKKCSPESPQGPCMVSYEGACLIHYKYAEPKHKERRLNKVSS